jgi:hypothetical protein
MLSLHFSHAGDHERAYRYATLAAERAERAYAGCTRAASAPIRLPCAKLAPAVERSSLRIRLASRG